MSDIQKIKIGEQEYTLKDGSAVAFDEAQALTEEQKQQARANMDTMPAPTSARVGQVLVVEAVDKNGKPTALKTTALSSGGGESNVVAAVFDYDSETCQLTCLSHNALELTLALHTDTTPVIGIVVDRINEEERTVMVGNYNGGICVGCPVGDGLWIHVPGHEYCYADGDVSNKTSGNELWNEY